MNGYFQTSKYFIAKVGGKVAGVVSATNDATIRTMCILPSFQSIGIGSKLLSMALDYLKDKPEIYLETGYQQEGRAFKFYEKFGFKKQEKKDL